MLKLYYAPMSRSFGIHWLLEELGLPYEAQHVDIRAEGGVPESYRAVRRVCAPGVTSWPSSRPGAASTQARPVTR